MIKLDDYDIFRENKKSLRELSKDDSDPTLRDAIGKHFMLKANQEYIRFDLERYKRLYFKNVHTYSVKEFVRYLEAML